MDVLRIRDVYPGSAYFSIQNPGFNNKKEKWVCCLAPFFEAKNLTNLKII
jgi:hypothetical protein